MLYKREDWLKRVFGKTKVARYNDNAFFFKLVATKILSFEWPGYHYVEFVITRDDDDNKVYKNPMNWEGIEFCSVARKSTVQCKYLLCTHQNIDIN